MKKEKKQKLIDEYITEYVKSYCICVSADTPLKWIKIFCVKMLDTRLYEENMDIIQKKLGFEFNKSDINYFKKVWADRFVKTMLDYQKQLSKCRNEEEKDFVKDNLYYKEIKKNKK